MAKDVGRSSQLGWRLGTGVLVDAGGSGGQAYAGAVFKVVMSAFVLAVEAGGMCNATAQVEDEEAMGSV